MPDPAAPIDPRLAAALATQLERWRATLAGGAARVGWKLGVGDGERIGDEAVAVGHLTTATVLEPDATYSAAGTSDLRADVEVAFEVGPDLTITGVGVALELVDLAGPPGGPEAVVAANIFHRAVAFGPFRPPPLPPASRAACWSTAGWSRGLRWPPTSPPGSPPPPVSWPPSASGSGQATASSPARSCRSPSTPATGWPPTSAP